MTESAKPAEPAQSAKPAKDLPIKDGLPFDRSICEVCGGQSGGRHIGVACIPGAPMSIAWCDECLHRDTAPAFIFEFDFIHVAGGNLANLAEWARDRETWADGRYISFDEFVKRITPEMVLEALADDPREESEPKSLEPKP
jgi:hypothetical protein